MNDSNVPPFKTGSRAWRQALFDEAGVVIVKDSSANKCGVITSSYEILASMLLTPEEFLLIKATLVPDVLTQLKRLAAVEAKLLFREAKADPATPIPKHVRALSALDTRRCVESPETPDLEARDC
jgi:glutamate dehydrogenase